MDKNEHPSVTSEIFRRFVKNNPDPLSDEPLPPKTVYYFVEKKAAKTCISKDICRSAVIDIYGVSAAVEVGYIHRYGKGTMIIFEYTDTHEDFLMTPEEYKCLKPDLPYEMAKNTARQKTQMSADKARNSIDTDDIDANELDALVTKYSVKKPKELVTC